MSKENPKAFFGKPDLSQDSDTVVVTVRHADGLDVYISGYYRVWEFISHEWNWMAGLPSVDVYSREKWLAQNPFTPDTLEYESDEEADADGQLEPYRKEKAHGEKWFAVGERMFAEGATHVAWAYHQETELVAVRSEADDEKTSNTVEVLTFKKLASDFGYEYEFLTFKDNSLELVSAWHDWPKVECDPIPWVWETP